MPSDWSERDFQAHVLAMAQAHGWLCYHTYDSRRSAPGFPDLLLVKDGFFIFAELKTERGRLTTAQAEWIEALREHGCDAVISAVWRPSDLDDIERILGGSWSSPGSWAREIARGG